MNELTPQSSPSDRLTSIDVWRGVAALSVVAVHIRHDAPGGFREHPFFLASFLMDFGYLGVPIFVMISGFCIHRKSALTATRTGTYRLNWGTFWKRRFWRLYPTYLIAIAFGLACRAALPGVNPLTEPLITYDVLTHLLLIHNLTKEFVGSLGNGVYWSLGMEEQLYALYFVLFLCISRNYRSAVVAIIAAITIAWRASVPFMNDRLIDVGPFHLGSWGQWPFHYWLHWTLGALAVDAHCGNISLSRWCRSVYSSALLLVLGTLINKLTFTLLLTTSLGKRFASEIGPSEQMIDAVSFLGELAFTVGCFCLINWSLDLERRSLFPAWLGNLFTPVGKISYSLYLTHVPVIYLLQEYFPLSPSPLGWTFRFLLHWPIVLGVAAGFFWLFERHFLGTTTASSRTHVRVSEPAPQQLTINSAATPESITP